MNDDVRVGVLVQRAYNPGGVTLDPAASGATGIQSEYLWDYEVFARASLFGGRASLTGNLFYNAMRDAQREHDIDFNSPGGTVGLLQILSEPRARSYGAELELNGKLSSALMVRAGLGWLNTQITPGRSHPNDPFLGKEFRRSAAFHRSRRRRLGTGEEAAYRRASAPQQRVLGRG